MQKETKLKNTKPSSNFREPQPEGKVPEGNKVVKKPQDKIYKKKDANSTYANPASIKETGEQPVHPVKNPPKD